MSMFGVFFTNFAYSSYIFFILIFFLEDERTFNMSPEKALSSAAWLVFLGYPFNVVSSLACGYLFVRFGRRRVILAGFLIAITSGLLFPFVGNTLYPNIFVLVALINVGTAWT